MDAADEVERPRSYRELYGMEQPGSLRTGRRENELVHFEGKEDGNG